MTECVQMYGVTWMVDDMTYAVIHHNKERITELYYGIEYAMGHAAYTYSYTEGQVK